MGSGVISEAGYSGLGPWLRGFGQHYHDLLFSVLGEVHMRFGYLNLRQSGALANDGALF